MQNCYFKGSKIYPGTLDNYLYSWEEICCHPVLAVINSGPVLFHLYFHLHHPALFWIIFETNHGHLRNMSLFFACAGSSLLLEGFSLFAKSRGYSALAAFRLLTAVASLLTERGLPSVWASVAAGLSLCHCGPAQ